MRFGLLGPLQVRVDDRELPVPAAKQRVLLAGLLLTPGRAVSPERLAELIWDGQPPRRSEVTLRSYVMRLRRALGPVGSSRIVTATGGYMINADDDEVDFRQFAVLCATGETAVRSREWTTAAGLLSRAERLWRGHPLADIPCQALHASEVPRLEELRLLAIQWRIQADLELGNCAKVVPELHVLTATHPLREPFHYQLMLALYQCGRQADALTAYRQARTVLVEELGIEPGADLRLMHQRILAGDRGLADERANGRTSTSASLPPGPRQLPAPPPHFVGRTTELQELTSLLSDGNARHGGTTIAVIGGTAGIGKTALAVYWAQQVTGSFPDGQIFLNLNGFGPAGEPMTQADMTRLILEALRVPLARIPSSLESRIGLYRTLLADRRLLIVFDNAKDADQIRPLLPTGAGCFALVTSRSPMTSLVALEAAHALALNVLTDSEARQLVAERLGARRSPVDSEAADQLIDACAGLPLALAIATALVATRQGHSLASLAARLTRADDRLDNLTAGEATADVRAVFDWSYQALTPAAARMFRLLAEHPGPDISAAAAASLAGMPARQAREALTRLSGSHLVDEHLPGRFAFHDLLRLYAAEQLRTVDSAADRRAAGRRMLDHYLHSARAAAQAINPTRATLTLDRATPGTEPEEVTDADQAMAWFEAEHRVLMRSISYGAEFGFDAHAWQLPWALSDYLDRGGHWHDWTATQRAALTAALRRGDVAAQAQAHRYLGRGCFQLQDFDEALDHLTIALELQRKLGDPVSEAGISIDLARLHEQRGSSEDALRSGQRALALYRSAGHRIGQAFALNSIGWYHALRGDYADGLTHCNQALELCTELGLKIAEGVTWDSLGYIHQHLGQPTQAVTCFGRAVDIIRQLGDRYNESRALDHMGDAYQIASDPASAREAWREALVILDDLDHPDGDQIRAKIASVS